MKFTIIAVSVPAVTQISEFCRKYNEKNSDDKIEAQYFYVAGSESNYILSKDKIITAIQNADVAIVDTMGASEQLQEIVRTGLLKCDGHRVIIGNALREYIRLGAFSMQSMGIMKSKSENKSNNNSANKSNGKFNNKSDKEDMLSQAENQKHNTKSALDKMHRMRRMALMIGNVLPFGITKDMKNVFLLIDYWQQATTTDIESFMHLILRQYFGKKHLPKEKPCTMQYGIYLKEPFSLKCETSLAKYLNSQKFDKTKDTVAVLFYGHSYPNDFLPVVKAVYNNIKQNYNVLPIAFSQNEDKDLEKLKEYLINDKTDIAAVINLMPFRLGAGPMGGDADSALEILKELDVPYIKPFCMTKVTKKEWEDADAINPGEFLISIMLPELDGGILTFPIGVMEIEQTKDETALPELVPIENRIDALCRRMTNLIKLQKIKNKDKKLAIIFYNYPPGESNVFGGAFLDAFASAEILLQKLKESGYNVDNLTTQYLIDKFVTGGNCNCPEWYEEEESNITYSCDGNTYNIKGIISKNVFIGLQPVRESNLDEIESYHDRNNGPSAQYNAFYKWIRDEFNADAMIHFGTHGTLEFMPGKDNGMTEKCFSDILVGDIPHFYYYYIGNPSEAMIAKRRSHATLISYEPPKLKASGLYGDYQELKETIAEYRESMQVAQERCGDLLNNVEKLAGKCGLKPENVEKFSAGMLDEIEDRLAEYEDSLITDGLHIINENEINGLLHALNGKYVSVSAAGDVIKNPDVLPSGRNLVQFDPRLVPTRTACERGAKVAEMAINKYLRETGKYPDTTGVILWGLETSRSQGETIGQIIYYLGLRLKSDNGSFDDRLEIIPAKELNRPRIDVIIHMCGFFRDMYPNLVDNLNEMLQKLLWYDEDDDNNYYAKNTKAAVKQLMKENSNADETEILDMASCRIFGPKEGEYGTGLTEIVRNGNWNEESALGNSFVEDLSYAYSYKNRGKAAKKLLKMQYSNVNFISQVRNNAEYELTDLDHYYEFYGGFAKAIENVKGDKPLMLVADTTGDDVKVSSLKAALERGIATRILNPAWIEGMMKHEYHGVSQIQKRFENIMGFAASTNQISSDTFSKMEKCYAENEKLKKQMLKSNKWAYMKMMERLMEANNRGYYDATEEELSQIREAYLEAEGEAEE